MQKFLLEIKDNPVQATIGYENDQLKLIEISSNWSEKGWIWISQRIPFDLTTFIAESKVIKWGKVTLIEEDLSFDVFWNAYDYKIGKKPRAESLWNSLTDPEKTSCLIGVKKYNYWFSTKTGMNKLYPETFLSQRRWENEFKV